MNAEDNDRDRGLEARLAELEARLEQLELAVAAAPRPTPRQPTEARPPAAPAVTRPVFPPVPTAPPAVPTVPLLVPAAPLAEPMARPLESAEPPVVPGAALVEPAPPAPPARSSVDILADLEERLTGRALAWVGGIALVLGAIFFLSLAFSRGWIGEEARVAIGLIAGTAGLVAGGVFMERGDRLLGHVLTPVGLAVISIALVGATRLYDLVPVEVGLAGAMLSAAVAAVIAVRANSQVVAAFGLVTVLAAPPLLGAAPDVATLAFVGAALIGTTGIALWRTWPWLPPLAFLLSAPQAASWLVGEPNAAMGLTGLAAFWALHALAAGGEEFRQRRDELSPTSAGLLLADAAFLMWFGFVLLSGDLEPYRGAFLVLVAVAHLCLGTGFIIRDGERHLFGLLAIGTGIAALTMAAPIQFGAPLVPVAWTAEAAALAWVAAWRRHPYGAVVSAGLFLMAGAYVVGVLYPMDKEAATLPFADPAGISLGFFLAGVVAGAWLVPTRVARSALAALGLLVATWCAGIELDGPSAIVAWMALAVVGTFLVHWLPTRHERRIEWQIEGLVPQDALDLGRELSLLAAPALAAASVLAGTAATGHLLLGEYAPWTGDMTEIPFADAQGAALAAYLVGLGLIGAMLRKVRFLDWLASIGLLVIAVACGHELHGVALVAAWSAVVLAALAAWRALGRPATLQGAKEWLRVLVGISPGRVPPAALTATAGVAGVLAAGHVLVEELPLASFGSVLPPTVPFSDAGAAAMAILAAGAVAAGLLLGGAQARRAGVIAAGAVVAYAIPFEVYAWAVAVLWPALAVAAFAASRIDRDGRNAYHWAGLAILVATAVDVIAIVAPPTRLVVSDTAVDRIQALQSVAALGSLVVALGTVEWLERAERWARWVETAAGVSLVYLLSVAAVDVFATQVGGPVAVEELQKQGQVALSVLWTVVGVAAFVAGLWSRRLELRQGGLALLALATAKVFLVDLSALDVAYRVISLVALGLLLLASAWLWQRLKPRGPTGNPRGPTAAPQH